MNHCTGAIPFEVKPDGIYWQGSTVRVGEYYPANPPLPPILAINLPPDGPPFDFTMTGTVQGGADLTLGAESWAEFSVRLNVAPDGGPASQNLKGSVAHAGQTPAPVWPASAANGEEPVLVRVQGGPGARADEAARTTVSASTEVGGRTRSASRSLLFGAGVSP